jgi:hypothetical protein
MRASLDSFYRKLTLARRHDAVLQSGDLLMRALLIAAALFAAAPAVAQAPAATRLTLADSAKAPARATIIDGARWSCEGAACTASGGTEQPATRACRRVVQKFGPVTAFTYKGTELSAEELAVCNA